MDINLEGLGVVREFSYKNGRLFLAITLEGLEDHPISIEARGHRNRARRQLGNG